MSLEQEKKERRLKLLEDHIGRSLAEAEKSGELKAAKSYGKPLDLGDGYDETPAELRMPFKMLKDSGYLPPEVQLMRDIEALRASLPEPGGVESAAVQAERAKLIEMRQQLALRMERLRASGSL
jgi:hypothetical protein